MPYTYAYPRSALTVDTVVFSLRAGDLAVLLVRRGKAPFKGEWALPGGFVEANEGLAAAAARELEEETQLAQVALEQLGAFGDPGRDPRGHTVSVVFFTFVVAEGQPLAARDDAVEIGWHPLASLALGDAPKKRGARLRPLAFDHGLIIECARIRLKQRLLDRVRPVARLDDPPKRPSARAPSPPVATHAWDPGPLFPVVPSHFTLSELQHVYEAVLGRALDKRNFRARLLAHGLVEPVAEQRTGRHRPAQLYRWAAASGRASG